MRASRPGAKRTNNPRFAYDSYRRLIQMFGNVVLEIPKHEFEEMFDGKKKQKKAKLDTELDAKALKEVIAEYKKLVRKHTKQDFPQDPHEQLVMARDAVFRSWQNDRAKDYRRINNIDDSSVPRSTCRPWCTATWATPAAPALASRATRQRRPKNSTASS